MGSKTEKFSQDDGSPDKNPAKQTLFLRDQLIVEQLIISVDENFEKLLAIYEKPLRIYVQRLVFSSKYSNDGDDVFQEATLNIYEGLKNHEGDVTWYHNLQLRGWLYKVTLNAFLRYIHKPLSNLTYIGDTEQHLEEKLQDSTPGPEEIQEHHEFVQEVTMAIEQLPEKYRAVLKLHCFDHLPDAEIATKLGEKVTTVKAHLHRGRKLLRKRLKDREFQNKVGKVRSNDGK